MQKKPRLVACPACKKLTEYNTSNQFRPFCCERCKMIDLGDWANENFKIPDKNLVDDQHEINQNDETN